MSPSRGSKDAEQTATGEIEQLRDFVARWLEAWNSHQPDRVLEFLTDDVEVRDYSWPRTMHGHADVREFLGALWRAIPDMRFELLDGPYLIPGEPRGALHWRTSGTFTGAACSPLSPPPKFSR